MRILSGKLIGSKILTNDKKFEGSGGFVTRPTSDRVKETLFNIVQHGFNIDISNVSFLDCFSGSGAIGLEAISRGCLSVSFLEKNNANNDYEDFNHSDFSFDIESKVNLRESLITQLDDFHLNEKEIKIAKLIIGCIDESGELAESTEQIEEISNFIYSEKEIENILLNIIHRLSPSGIGYRNHKECIKIQIDNKKNISKTKRALIENILLNDKLDNLPEIRKIAYENGYTDKEFKSALNEIKNCDCLLYTSDAADE